MTSSIKESTAIVFPFVLAYLDTLKSLLVDSSQSNTCKKTRKSSLSNPHAEKVRTSNKNLQTSKYAEASFLSLGQAATARAMLLLISTAPNLIDKATVENFVPGSTISFKDWFIIGLPHAIIGLLILGNIVSYHYIQKLVFSQG